MQGLSGIAKLGLLGMAGSVVVMSAWAYPAFGADASGTAVARGSTSAHSTLEAKRLSDAELDEITAGLSRSSLPIVVMEIVNPAPTSIPGMPPANFDLSPLLPQGNPNSIIHQLFNHLHLPFNPPSTMFPTEVNTALQNGALLPMPIPE